MDARGSNPFPRHLPQLDGLRGLAIVLVLCHHLAPDAFAMGQGPSPLMLAFRYGWAGVDLFFVLSGFLITGILYDHRASSHRVRAFYGRRLLRIAPLYYVALLLYGAVVPLLTTSVEAVAFYEALPWHMAYLTNIRVAIEGTWNASPLLTLHLWSLAVEEQFYLVWPAIVWFVVRQSKSPRVILMAISGSLIVISVAFRLWLLPYQPLAAYVLLPARMDALAIGALLALWVRGPQSTEPLKRVAPFALAWGGAALVALCVTSAELDSYISFPQQSVGYTLWAIVWGALLSQAALHPDGVLARGLQFRPLLYTGRISYALYLVHFPVMFVLGRLGMREWGGIPFVVAVLLVSFALSEMSWRVLEAPLLTLKRLLPYEASPQPVLPSQGQRAV